jgi:LysM repeat protein
MKVILFLILFAFSLQVHAQQSKFYAAKNERGLFIEHKVQPKENWYSVGRMYAISPKEIAAFNGLSMDKGLSIGQALKVPLVATNFIQTVSAVGVPVYHAVQPKEGLLKVASNYGLTLAGIKNLNTLTTDQIATGTQLIVGYIGANTNPVVATAPVVNNASSNPVSTAPVANNTISKPPTPQPAVNTAISKPQPAPASEQKTVVVEKPREEAPKPVEKPAEKVAQPKVVATEVKPAVSGNNYFATGFTQQSKEGKEQKLDNPVYGIFKSSSGWQDGKYYMLMNDVVPGTIVKITTSATGKFIHAKVLGAVPPGKESEGMALRISNAAAAALGVETTAMLSLVWYK